MQWISIEDQLPERFENVLGFIGGTIDVCSYGCDEYETPRWNDSIGDPYGAAATHWQPLPPPPSSHNSN